MHVACFTLSANANTNANTVAYVIDTHTTRNICSQNIVTGFEGSMCPISVYLGE